MNSDQSSVSKRPIEVPRDSDLDTADKSHRSKVTPSPDKVNMPDEAYPAYDKPLLPDSKEARALQDHPPKAKGELETGSGGDAGRAGKTGISNLTLQPHEQAG